MQFYFWEFLKYTICSTAKNQFQNIEIHTNKNNFKSESQIYFPKSNSRQHDLQVHFCIFV